MAKTPMVAVHHSVGRDSPIWGPAFSSGCFAVSDDSEAKYASVASSFEDNFRLRTSRSLPTSRASCMYKPEALPMFRLPQAPPEPSLHFLPGSSSQAGNSLESSSPQAGGRRCAFGRYASGRSSMLSATPPEPPTAYQTHILKLNAYQRKDMSVTSQRSRTNCCSSGTERVTSENAAAPLIKRVEHPVVFSSFFDRMKLDHLVAAKDKILQSLAGRAGNEGSTRLQGFDASSSLSSRRSETLSPVDPSVQVLGGVDLGVLYSRYQKSTEGRSSKDGYTTSASQQGPAADASLPVSSETEGETPVPQEKVFRTEAAARLAEAPEVKKLAAGAAAPEVGLRLIGLWPKQLQRQQPSSRHAAAKTAEQPQPPCRTVKPLESRACRISHRRPVDMLNPCPELRAALSPRHLINSVAQEGPYTHIIPVTKNGSTKGLVRNKHLLPKAEARKGGHHHTAARVVEASEYRFFVFNIPECELIRSSEFQLTSCISQGSFGTVYKAKWKGDTVAVKQAHGKMTLEAMRSVAREVNSYRMIDHPFIVKYYGVCLEHNFVALVTEYLNGGNIFDILFENKVNISAAVRLKMCRQLLEAVHFLHIEKRLVHRDLKTANLVVDGQYNIRLCDFGKTRSLEQHGKLKLEDNGGSPRYMAPECFVEGNYVDQKVDIWGLACCLIEILGGPIPFEDIHSNEGVIQELLYKRRRPMVPAWFHPVVRGTLDMCFMWNASERPDTQYLKEVFAKLTPAELNQYGMNQKRPS